LRFSNYVALIVYLLSSVRYLAFTLLYFNKRIVIATVQYFSVNSISFCAYVYTAFIAIMRSIQ